ncbi:DNA-binding response regulator [Methylovorus sp. MM2]|uniref:response regulator n=1 Tax=Methylovorus sp. MM2 TaxID=1848038 RepID=UPI0007DFBBF0|nr:response regulator transcription factor [Methylovorus sp. MM2]OAM53196.1 DNA-binding response regulator [Methylovorus sp. MM2]
MPTVSDNPDVIRLVLIEDDIQFNRHFKDAMKLTDEVVLLGTASSVKDGLALIKTTEVDVLVVDLGLPDGSGIELIKAAKKRLPTCQIMVFSIFGDEVNVLKSIEAGATGYLLKEYTPDQLIQEIKNLHAGGSPISPIIARQILLRMHAGKSESAEKEGTDTSSLSSREQEVLNLITQGFSYGDIAKKLDISYHTVRTFVRRVYLKLEVNSQAEAVAKGRDKGLL